MAGSKVEFKHTTIRISQAGGCPRRIALEARGVEGLPISPATQRAFDEGNLHEASILEWALANIPGAPWRINHQQDEVAVEERLIGHIDGLGWRCPEEYKFEYVLLEAKCLAARAFQELRTSGCRASHPQYFTQIQLYLRALDGGGGMLGRKGLIKKAYLVARNKNTPATRQWDHHYEEIAYDPDFCKTEVDRLCELAKAIDRGDDIPVPEGYSPDTTWRCRVRWCPFGYVCHPTYQRKLAEIVQKDDLADAVEQYQGLGEQIGELTAARDELKERLLASVDDTPVQAGNWLLRAQDRRTERFDTKAARQTLDAATLAKLLTVTTSRQLKIEEVE
jgi:hypothetical protein